MDTSFNNCVLHIWPEGHWEPHIEVGSLSLAKHLAGFEPGTFQFLQHLNPLGHSLSVVERTSPSTQPTWFTCWNIYLHLNFFIIKSSSYTCYYQILHPKRYIQIYLKTSKNCAYGFLRFPGGRELEHLTQNRLSGWTCPFNHWQGTILQMH